MKREAFEHPDGASSVFRIPFQIVGKPYPSR